MHSNRRIPIFATASLCGADFRGSNNLDALPTRMIGVGNEWRLAIPIGSIVAAADAAALDALALIPDACLRHSALPSPSDAAVQASADSLGLMVNVLGMMADDFAAHFHGGPPSIEIASARIELRPTGSIEAFAMEFAKACQGALSRLDLPLALLELEAEPLEPLAWIRFDWKPSHKADEPNPWASFLETAAVLVEARDLSRSTCAAKKQAKNLPL